MREVEIIQEVWNLFNQILDGSYKLYLFGSRSTGKSKTYSDFDFCILGSKPINEKKMNRLKIAVEDIDTLYSIDLVDLQKVNPELKEIIEKEMVEIVNGKVRSS